MDQEIDSRFETIPFLYMKGLDYESQGQLKLL